MRADCPGNNNRRGIKSCTAVCPQGHERKLRLHLNYNSMHHSPESWLRQWSLMRRMTGIPASFIDDEKARCYTRRFHFPEFDGES
jgi:hypothetical protein